MYDQVSLLESARPIQLKRVLPNIAVVRGVCRENVIEVLRPAQGSTIVVAYKVIVCQAHCDSSNNHWHDFVNVPSAPCMRILIRCLTVEIVLPVA